MSLFDKIIISLIEPNLKSIDFTSLTGFIGCYTSDPDKPTDDKQFLIAFDNRIRNEYTKDLAIRLSKSMNVKNTYIKIIDTKPYCVYSFYVNPEVKQYYNTTVNMPIKHKMKFIKFWSDLDSFVEQICSTVAIQLNHDEKLPLEDYRPSILGE